jgi:hypothetical protein
MHVACDLPRPTESGILRFAPIPLSPILSVPSRRNPNVGVLNRGPVSARPHGTSGNVDRITAEKRQALDHCFVTPKRAPKERASQGNA